MLDRIPLEAFRVFDAACRAMNFSRAGRELNITQAAVSRRIKGLEEELNTPLFTRRGRNLALTPAGERLALRVRSTLEYLEESLEPFRGGQGQVIQMAASGSVSHLWLGARLRAFSGDHPDVTLKLLTSDSQSEVASDNNDLMILYSTGEHPRWTLSKLFAEVLVPVASPACLGDLRARAADLSADEIAALGLIDYERFNAHWISFRQWFARMVDQPRQRIPAPRFSYSTYAMAMNAALAGDGVALGSRALIEDHLTSGRLVALGGQSLVTGFGYYIGLPRYRAVAPDVRVLHDQLLEFARVDVAQ
nr:LysR substrate-binding domain-containing protein [uncultured Gellertiella sp.]